MADTTPQKTPTRMRPWLRVLLFASLALNLAVAGIVAGAVLRGGPSPHDRRGGDRDYAIPYTRAFDETQRGDLRRALRDGYDARRANGDRPGLTEDYAQALRALRADPFDPDALSVILDRQGAQARDRMTLGQEVLGAYLRALPAEERRAYADRLQVEIDMMSRRRDRWKGDH